MPLPEITITDDMVNKHGLSQSYSSGLEYTLINHKNQMLIPFVTCKDYINDTIWAIVNKKTAMIYGVEVNPNKAGFVANLRQLRIVVREKTLAFDPFFDSMVNSVNFINDSFKNMPTFPEINIEAVANFEGKKCVVMNFPIKFMLAGPLMSTLFIYIRSGQKYDRNHKEYPTPLKYINNMSKIPGASYRGPDAGDIKGSRKLVYRLAKGRLRKLFSLSMKENYGATHRVSTVHNNYGIRDYVNNKRFEKMFHKTF